jgi:hypothetical protein
MKLLFHFGAPTNDQIDKCSDISADLGTVSIASVVLPAILTQPRIALIAQGVGAAIFLWIVSYWILSLKKH